MKRIKYKHTQNKDGTFTVERIDDSKKIKDLSIVELLIELNKPFKLNGRRAV